MWRQALAQTTLFLLGWVFLAFGQLDCLIPYKKILWKFARHYAEMASWFVALLGVNVFACLLILPRVFLHKGTGEKLTLVEKQISEGDIELEPS